jgi:hypothetical protein
MIRVLFPLIGAIVGVLVVFVVTMVVSLIWHAMRAVVCWAWKLAAAYLGWMRDLCGDYVPEGDPQYEDDRQYAIERLRGVRL